MNASVKKAIEAQLKAIRWEVAVLEGWELDDRATRRRRAQSLVELARALVIEFDRVPIKTPAPENTKEPKCLTADSASRKVSP